MTQAFVSFLSSHCFTKHYRLDIFHSFYSRTHFGDSVSNKKKIAVIRRNSLSWVFSFNKAKHDQFLFLRFWRGKPIMKRRYYYSVESNNDKRLIDMFLHTEILAKIMIL